MFSTPQSLRRRTGRFGVGRFEYLKQLLNEYEHPSTDEENKLQILANFANFSYDPINYGYFRTLNLIDLFLDCLRLHTDDDFAQYALAGLCNLSADRTNGQLIVEKHSGIAVSLVRCLYSNRLEMVLNSMLTLMFLCDHQEKLHNQLRQRKEIRECLEQYAQSQETRLANMARVFLDDYFSSSNSTL